MSSATDKIGWAVNALFPKPQTVSIAPGGPVPLRTLRAGSSVVQAATDRSAFNITLRCFRLENKMKYNIKSTYL